MALESLLTIVDVQFLRLTTGPLFCLLQVTTVSEAKRSDHTPTYLPAKAITTLLASL